MEDSVVSECDWTTTDGLVSEVLENELIIQKLLSYLGVPDLLTCSLVNKCWNYASRKFLRDHRKCFIRLKSPDQCLELLNISSRLPRMNVIPYNGLIIDVDVKEHFRCVRSPNFETKYQFLLSFAPFKYLMIEWAGGGEHMDECPILDLIDNLLLKNSLVIEELTMSDPPRILKANGSVSLMTRRIAFPLLKVLRINEQFGKFDANLVAGLTIAASNLQEISGLERTSRIRQMIPPMYYHLIKDLWLSLSDTDKEESFLRNFAAAQPQLKSIMVEQLMTELSHASKEAIKLLLASSRDSLESVKIGACALVKLIRYEMPVFHRVSYVELYMDYCEYEAQMETLISLNFPKYFPALKSMYVGHGIYGHEIDINVCTCILLEPDQCSNMTITCQSTRQLRLQLSPLIQPTFHYLTRIFPFITSLEWMVSDMVRHPQLCELYSQIWGAWPYLEQIKIHHSRLPLDGNLDWIYCGIHPEEAHELQFQDEEFLESVHIVPIRESLTSLPRLKKLTIRLDGQYFEIEEALLLSAVTGLLVLSRTPGVDVNIECMGNFGVVNHLAPYGNVTYL